MLHVTWPVRDMGWKTGVAMTVLGGTLIAVLGPQLTTTAAPERAADAAGLAQGPPSPEPRSGSASGTFANVNVPKSETVAATEPVVPSPSMASEADHALPALVHPIPIEDPAGRALKPFHRALHDLAAGKRDKVRLVFFGASHVASDLFTDVVRRQLQERFGNGGPGFLLPAKPRRFHYHSRADYQAAEGFKGLQVRVSTPGMERYGLAGVALDAARKRRAYAVMQTRAPTGPGNAISRLTLYYMKQPKGGHLGVRVDGKRRGRIATSFRRKEPGYHELHIKEGEHQLQLQTYGDGPVRIFGVALENDRPGVVVDTLGVPGARVRYQLQWHPSIFRNHLKRRDPALVVLAYGTNEAGDDDVPLSEYEGQLKTALRRVKATVPKAACLLIGPSDQPIRDRQAGTLSDRPRTLSLVKIQRRVAAKYGCGFFDLVSLMGGAMTMPAWVEAQLGAQDHIHFTRSGYGFVGEVLTDALMQGY